jgi:hypothetical protein
MIAAAATTITETQTLRVVKEKKKKLFIRVGQIW